MHYLEHFNDLTSTQNILGQLCAQAVSTWPALHQGTVDRRGYSGQQEELFVMHVGRFNRLLKLTEVSLSPNSLCVQVPRF